jgi:hypothetical protein
MVENARDDERPPAEARDREGLERPGPPPDPVEIAIPRDLAPANGGKDLVPETSQDLDVLTVELDPLENRA